MGRPSHEETIQPLETSPLLHSPLVHSGPVSNPRDRDSVTEDLIWVSSGIVNHFVRERWGLERRFH